MAAGNPGAQTTKLPGVVAIDWIPTFGESSKTTDPASIAGKEFYGRVRAAYSGQLDADAPDYIVYVGALDSLFAYLGWLKRVYRTISTYSPDNRTLPDHLMAAYGITSPADIEDLRKNKTRFWQGINELILMSRKYKCPAVMDLFNRHYWLSDNVYADAASARAQLYVFNLRAIYHIDQVTEMGSGTNQVTGLTYVEIPTTGGSGVSITESLLQFGRSLMNDLDEWDSVYTISGYLQRAFDGVPNFAVAELEQGELLTSSYTPEVLSQIENARVLLPQISGSVRETAISGLLKAAFVSQNTLTNAVYSTTAFTFNITLAQSTSSAKNSFQMMNYLPNGPAPAINMHVDAPSVADTVIASRLQVACGVSIKDNTTKFTCAVSIVSGTEIPLGIYMVHEPTSTTDYDRVEVEQVRINDVEDLTSETTPGAKLSAAYNPRIEQFGMHPIIYECDGGAANGVPNLVRLTPCTDVYNVTVFTAEMLANLHHICFYSELNSFSI